jgi:hypothetical protein
VFSNAALHWMRDADAVLAGVKRALAPRGRFVAEMGGHACVAKIRWALARALERRGVDAAKYDPWYFPTDAEYRTRLERAGFAVRTVTLFDRPTPLPTDIEGWLATFANGFLSAVPASERAAVVRETRSDLEPLLFSSNGWIADYVRLRFDARCL